MPFAIAAPLMLELIKTERENHAMKTFLVACIAAAVIAIGAVAVLGNMQKPVETAFTTSGVRI